MSTSADGSSVPRSTTRSNEESADVEIRPVAVGDLDALVDVYLAGAEHHAAIDPDAFRVPEREDAAARLRRRLDARGPEHEYVAAVIDGTVVGSATLDLDDLPSPGAMARPIRSAELGIAVLEGYRGRGVGRRLMAHLEGWAAANGVERVILNVSATNEAALRLYHELGYVDSGVELRKNVHAT